MRCLDQESIQLFGNYDTGIANNLMIVFEKCDPASKDYCKSEQEIYNWLSFKYFLLIENQKRFIPHQFSQNDRILAMSSLKWIPIS